MEQKLINEKWESNFFYEGTFVIVHDYLIKNKKNQFSVACGSEFNERLFNKNPRLKEMAQAIIELQNEILKEFIDLPNCIWDNTEVTACDIIKKHIALGNIRVDNDLTLDYDDNFFSFVETADIDLIVDDIVYKDLCRNYINENPDWKAHIKEHQRYQVEYDEAINDIGRRQQEVINILAEHGTNIYGHNL